MTRARILSVLLLLSPAYAHAGDVASWYGDESGSKTASGERFDPLSMTCAHPSLPFNTRLRVTYQGRSVVCRVNDRGPYVEGRTIDLSLGAARAIGLEEKGVDKVTVERMF